MITKEEFDEAVRFLGDSKPDVIGYVTMLCRNCKFWQNYNSEFGKCNNLDVNEYWSYNEGQRPMFPPDFGCIHFEVKNGNK